MLEISILCYYFVHCQQLTSFSVIGLKICHCFKIFYWGIKYCSKAHKSQILSAPWTFALTHYIHTYTRVTTTQIKIENISNTSKGSLAVLSFIACSQREPLLSLYHCTHLFAHYWNLDKWNLLFCVWLFVFIIMSVAQMHVVLIIAVVHSFLLQSSIPLNEYTIVCLFILLRGYLSL